MRGNAFAAICGMCLLGPGTALADTVLYSSIPGSIPPNVPSLGYEATSTSQFGDLVTLATGPRVVSDVTILMSNWAVESTYEPVGTSPGFYVPMTLSLYSVINGPTPTVGSLIASTTTNSFIAWRPEASGGCGSGYLASDNQCYNGLAQTVSFNMGGVLVPDSVIVGLTFNTQNYGPNPTGTAGPYDSLNFGLNDTSGPSVGTDVNSDAVFWDTSYQGFLTSGTAGVFGQDTNWSPYVPAMTIYGIPEPNSSLVFLAGLACLGFAVRGRVRGFPSTRVR